MTPIRWIFLFFWSVSFFMFNEMWEDCTCTETIFHKRMYRKENIYKVVKTAVFYIKHIIVLLLLWVIQVLHVCIILKKDCEVLIAVSFWHTIQISISKCLIWLGCRQTKKNKQTYFSLCVLIVYYVQIHIHTCTFGYLQTKHRKS